MYPIGNGTLDLILAFTSLNTSDKRSALYSELHPCGASRIVVVDLKRSESGFHRSNARQRDLYLGIARRSENDTPHVSDRLEVAFLAHDLDIEISATHVVLGIRQLASACRFDRVRDVFALQAVIGCPLQVYTDLYLRLLQRQVRITKDYSLGTLPDIQYLVNQSLYYRVPVACNADIHNT